MSSTRREPIEWVHWTEKPKAGQKCIPKNAGCSFLVKTVNKKKDTFSVKVIRYFGWDYDTNYMILDELHVILDGGFCSIEYAMDFFNVQDRREIIILFEKCGLPPPALFVDPKDITPVSGNIDSETWFYWRAEGLVVENKSEHCWYADGNYFCEYGAFNADGYIVFGTDYTWTDGASGNTLWNDVDNWGGVGFPDDNNDTGTLDNTWTSNATVNVAVACGEVILDTGYTGVVTQNDTMLIDDAGTENGNLTVTQGEWDSNGQNLSVDNIYKIDTNGTGTCGASDLQLGATIGQYALDVDGMFDGGSGNHTIDDGIIIRANADVTFTSGKTDITHVAGPSNICWVFFTGYTFDDGDGTVEFGRDGAQYIYESTNQAITLYDVIINGGASQTVQYFNGAGYNLQIDNTFTVITGEFDTSETVSGTSRDISVVDTVAVSTATATLTMNDSVITLGDAGQACTISNTNGTINVDTASIFGSVVGFKYIATGDDWDWDSSGGTCNIKWGDYQFDITTGGGAIEAEFDGDCTIDAITVTAGDTLKCVTDNVTITGDIGKIVTIAGAIQFNGTSGNEIALGVGTGISTLTTSIGATVDLQYVDIICRNHGINLANNVTVTQIDNCSITSTKTTAGAGISSFEITNEHIITNCTIDSGVVAPASWVVGDISLSTNCFLILDNCTLVNGTVALRQTGGYVIQKSAASDFIIMGTLADSETPSAGYRAADITGDLTTSNAAVYATPFNTSYTLGANCTNVDNLTTDTDTTFDTSGTDYNFTATNGTGYANRCILAGNVNCNGSTFIVQGMIATGSGTFNGMTSTLSIGSGTTNYYAILAGAGSTIDFGSATCTFGSLNTNTTTTITLSSGVTTIDSAFNDIGLINRDGISTWSHGNGEVIFTYAGAQQIIDQVAGSHQTMFYDFTINNGACVCQFGNAKGFNLTIANDFTITAGSFSTVEAVSGTSRDLTVENDYTNGDTSIWNDSVITLGDAGHACAIDNTGGTIDVDTATVYAGVIGNKYIATGNDWNWDSSGGTCNIKWFDFQSDVVTGGGGIDVQIDGDGTIDGWTVTANDAITCTIQDTIITCNAAKDIFIRGTIEMTGASGHNVVMTGGKEILCSLGSEVVDVQYFTSTMVRYALYIGTGANVTQIDNCTLSSTDGINYAGLASATTTEFVASNCTLDSNVAAPSTQFDGDIACLIANAKVLLDTCVLVNDTATMHSTGGYIVSKDHNAVVNQWNYYGILDSDDPAAGYQASNWVAGMTLNIKNADAYSTPFNTELTLTESGVVKPDLILKDPNTIMFKSQNVLYL